MPKQSKILLTVAWLRQHEACHEGIVWFEQQSARAPLDVLDALIAGDALDWANWLIVRVMSRPQRLAYAIYAAEQVLPLYEQRYPQDLRPRQTIDAANACLHHDTTANRRKADKAARAAARAAAWAAREAEAAAEAARAAAGAARAAARAAAWAAREAEAAAEAARAAAGAAEAAGAARAAAWAEAGSAAEAAWAKEKKRMQLAILAHGLDVLKS